jgi:hypothetical protein
MQDAAVDRALLYNDDRFPQMLILDSCFVLVVSTILNKMGIVEDDNSVYVVAINMKYLADQAS